MDERWNLDLHSHTLWSKDCLASFEKIIHLCRQRGVDRIAITDHNTADGALAMQKLAPDLVIVGEEDTITPLPMAQTLAEKIPNTKLEIIPRAGHLSNIEQPELFNTAVLNFARGL